MVYKGRPSAGCENCRKAKKLCDQGLPACSRCVRLGKACGGYRDLTNLIFKNETANVTLRASSQSDSGAAGPSSVTRPPTPEIEITAKRFFFAQFVTPSHLAFLEGISPDEFLLKPIVACALAARANLENDEEIHELARSYYVESITATNTALRHPRRVKEDNTLVAVCLLSVFELLSWERGGTSHKSWRHHVEGATHVLQLRGRSQIRTKNGALLFRELRNKIINNALITELEVPEFVVQWSQALEFDPMLTPGDEISVLSARLASLRASYRSASQTDEALSGLANALEKDLLSWSESTLAAGSICSFHNVRDLDSPHSWNGTRHEYGIPEAHRSWNRWRCVRIMLSRLQESLWRRSWPTLSQSTDTVHDSEYYKAIRTRMVNDICIAAAYAFGNDSTMEPPDGAVASGYTLLLPLCVAGTCLLEHLAEPTVSPGGSRMILVDQPLHEILFDQTSMQLAWIVERVDYIAEKVGIKWATAISRFLKGERKIYYDLGRSRVVKNEELEAELYGDLVDLTLTESGAEEGQGGSSNVVSSGDDMDNFRW